MTSGTAFHPGRMLVPCGPRPRHPALREGSRKPLDVHLQEGQASPGGLGGTWPGFGPWFRGECSLARLSAGSAPVVASELQGTVSSSAKREGGGQSPAPGHTAQLLPDPPLEHFSSADADDLTYNL